MSQSNLFDFVPGKELSVISNRAARPATVLALHNNQMLVEYRFPKGTTALLCFDVAGEGDEDTWWGRNRQYKTLSLAWLQAMKDEGVPWAGTPRHRIPSPWTVPSAEHLLQQRTFRRFWHRQLGYRFLARIRRSGWKEVRSWGNGGSGIAAQAILTWIRSSTLFDQQHVHARLMSLATQQGKVGHVFVSVVTNGQEWCIDTEGVKTREALLQRWEWMSPPEEQPRTWGEGDVQDRGISFSQAISEEIADRLREHVGQFSPELLFPTYTRTLKGPRGSSHLTPLQQGRRAA